MEQHAENVIAATMMAQSLNCCLEKKYLDSLKSSTPLIEVVSNDVSRNIYRHISWLKIQQVGKPTIDGVANCFAYIQKILYSCALPNTQLTFLVIGDGIKCDIYLGLRDNGIGNVSMTQTVANLNAFSKACWPGLVTKQINEADDIIRQHFETSYHSITAFTGIPTVTDKKDDAITTIEHVIAGMHGQKFAYLVTASPVGRERLDDILSQCRDMAGQLESVKTLNISKSVQDGYSEAHAKAHTEFENWSKSNSCTQRDYKKAAGASLLGAGLYMSAGFLFPPALAIMPGIEKALDGALLSSNPLATFLGLSGMSGMNILSGFVPQNTTGSTKGGGFSDTVTDTETKSHTVSESLSRTLINKHVEAACRQLETYAKRFELAKATGAWDVGCYLFSESPSSTASWQLKSLLSGEESTLEPIRVHDISAVVPSKGTAKASTLMIKYKDGEYFKHPFGEDFSQLKTLLTTRELSALVNFPLHSVPGLPVVEHASLAKEVVRYSHSNAAQTVNLGCIFDYGLEYPENRVSLRAQSLTQHVFVTGSTGCGKSETVYKLIDEARSAGAKFLIIEPAKGEYKNVFGDVAVFGTNPRITRLLRINPFQFPAGKNGIHVLEHVDRIVEIFNVCWPMYAAMPAVLKKAVLACYEKCGWDLVNSSSRYEKELFPTFADLQQELVQAINESAYSEEVKGNYIGSLVTRVESLTNGINGEIFTTTDIGDEVLFDENVIVDLSRVGSQETKSLIMGILIMRLSEYRMSTAQEANSELHHITVLEEAHNILKRTSMEQSMEGSNVTGKSVEMITNAIAEMRTYGESFVIVDQSPTSVAPAAIKNTNTKIIMRLPDGDDRRITGKAASMKDGQIDEIAKLPTGVAVVYQNDWVSPVLCKIDMYKGERKGYTPVDETRRFDNSKAVFAEILKFLLKGRSNVCSKIDVDFIFGNIEGLKIPTSLKIEVISAIEKAVKGDSSLWDNENFVNLSQMVTELLSAQTEVQGMVNRAQNFHELDESLDRFITQKTSIQENLLVVIRQCLMRYYGEKSETQMRIYDAWFNETKKSLLS